MSDRDDDEPLGYKHPPKWTRFRRGESGNPKGRPKKKKKENPALSSDSEMDRIRRETLNQEIMIKEAGVLTKRKAVEILMKSQLNNGIKGNVLAQRDAIRGAEELEKRDAQRAKEQQELAEGQIRENAASELRLFNHFAKLKQSQSLAWSEARAEGKDEPDFPWPHPDDIMLDDARKLYRLRGPIHGDDVALFRFMRAQRDLSLARMARELNSTRASRLTAAKVWAILVHFNNVQLPLRWQLDLHWVEAATGYFAMSPREMEAEIDRLEKDVQLWARIAKIKSDSDSYRFANDVLKPALNKYGYKSLAQFHRAYEDTDGNPPWPKLA